MNHASTPRQAADGDPVSPGEITDAVTFARMTYDDGASQIFDPDGTTEYVERGRVTSGTWYVDENGRFCSFWPPSYRACYSLEWVAHRGQVTGLRFSEVAGSATFVGSYE